jgi:hypothetical protein
MRDLLNNKTCLVVGLLVSLLSSPVVATEIKQVQTSLHGDNYELSADIDYQLTEKAKEALENGVPLYWELRIKLVQQRDILWAKTLVDLSIRYRLQYHALLNMYRVVIIQPDDRKKNGDSYNFSTLSAALDLMASLHNMPLIEQSKIKANKQYIVQIKANFERDALPLPLQPIAYINPQWYLSSDWTNGVLEK